MPSKMCAVNIVSQFDNGRMTKRCSSSVAYACGMAIAEALTLPVHPVSSTLARSKHG